MPKLIWPVAVAVAAVFRLTPVQAQSPCDAWPPTEPQPLQAAPALTVSGRSGRIFCGDAAAEDCAVVEGGDIRVLTLMVRRSGYMGCALTEYMARCTVARVSREWAITAAHCLDCGRYERRCRSPEVDNRFVLIQRRNQAQMVLPVTAPPVLLEGGDLALLKLGAAAGVWFDAIPRPSVKLVSVNPPGEITESEALVFGFGAAGRAGATDETRLIRARMRFAAEGGFWRLRPSEGALETRLCGGDSGGPVVLPRNNWYVLIGVMSKTEDRSCEAEAQEGATATNVIPFTDAIAPLIE